MSDQSLVRGAGAEALRYPLKSQPEPGQSMPVAPGVHWLRMPLPMALNHINLWALEDGDGWTLVAGEQDRIAPFALQQQTMADVRRVNGCSEKGTDWAPGCTNYASKADTPLVTFIHSGGHALPKEAPELIVRFFKGQKAP